MDWLGLDIGGANIKVADGRGFARSVPFPLWRKCDELPARLRGIFRESPATCGIAIAMTGELADCYESKAEGVRHILRSLEDAADDREIRVYLLDGRFVSAGEATGHPELAAASNWFALAHYASRYADGKTSILIDVGSTTTDLIPLVDGRLIPKGPSDSERLLSGELVYTGVGRTPICAVTDALPWRGDLYPIAAEVFATTADAYVALGEIPEDYSATWTADGRPLTVEHSRRRLARMLCLDGAQFSLDDARQAAIHVRATQVEAINTALTQVVQSLGHDIEQVVTSGSGEFLANEVVRQAWPQADVVSLSNELGNEVSRCAPAHALAVLAREVIDGR